MKSIRKNKVLSNILLSLLSIPIAVTIPIVKIIEHLVENKESYPLKISKETGIDYWNLDRYLDKLEKNKVIERESFRKKGRKVRININPNLLKSI